VTCEAGYGKAGFSYSASFSAPRSSSRWMVRFAYKGSYELVLVLTCFNRATRHLPPPTLLSPPIRSDLVDRGYSPRLHDAIVEAAGECECAVHSFMFLPSPSPSPSPLHHMTSAQILPPPSSPPPLLCFATMTALQGLPRWAFRGSCWAGSWLLCLAAS